HDTRAGPRGPSFPASQMGRIRAPGGKKRGGDERPSVQDGEGLAEGAQALADVRRVGGLGRRPEVALPGPDGGPGRAPAGGGRARGRGRGAGARRGSRGGGARAPSGRGGYRGL